MLSKLKSHFPPLLKLKHNLNLDYWLMLSSKFYLEVGVSQSFKKETLKSI